MPYVDGLGNVNLETAIAHDRQVVANMKARADWINDVAQSEFARQVDAECFRTGQTRTQVINAWQERQRRADT